MNINSQVSSLPLATVVNPPTDNLRRENNLREVIAPTAAASQSAAEKGVASDKDKARNNAQPNEQYNFSALRKQSDLNQTTINENAQDSSGEGKQEQREQQDSAQIQSEQDNKDTNNETNKATAPTNEQSLPPEILQQISELKKRDQEVRAHETAHAAVGGNTTGAPSFTYEQGPDGRRYAVSGEVSVDLSPVAGDPQATIAKMQKVHAAALAPANPSAQDKQVASAAIKTIASAQTELLKGESASNTVNQPRKKDVFKGDSSEAQVIQPNEKGQSTEKPVDSEQDFDRIINKTLKAQEQIAPTRSVEIDQRALRIENYYSKITQAYHSPSTPNLQLTA